MNTEKTFLDSLEGRNNRTNSTNLERCYKGIPCCWHRIHSVMMMPYMIHLGRRSRFILDISVHDSAICRGWRSRRSIGQIGRSNMCTAVRKRERDVRDDAAHGVRTRVVHVVRSVKRSMTSHIFFIKVGCKRRHGGHCIVDGTSLTANMMMVRRVETVV